MKKIGSIVLVVSLIVFGITLASCTGVPGGKPGSNTVSGGAPSGGNTPTGEAPSGIPSGNEGGGTSSDGDGSESGDTSESDSGCGCEAGCRINPDGSETCSWSCSDGSGGDCIKDADGNMTCPGSGNGCSGSGGGGGESDGGSGDDASDGNEPNSKYFFISSTSPQDGEIRPPIAVDSGVDERRHGIVVEFGWVGVIDAGAGEREPEIVQSSITNETVTLVMPGALRPSVLSFFFHETRKDIFYAFGPVLGAECQAFTLTIRGGPDGIHMTQGGRQYDLADEDGHPIDAVSVTFSTGRLDGQACP